MIRSYSDNGNPSTGLTMLYFPTVIALILMSSVMHFVAPVSKSNRIALTDGVNDVNVNMIVMIDAVCIDLHIVER